MQVMILMNVFIKQVERADVESYEDSSKTAPPYIELTVTQLPSKSYTPPNLAVLVEFSGMQQPDKIILKGAICVSNYACMYKPCTIRKLFHENINSKIIMNLLYTCAACINCIIDFDLPASSCMKLRKL